MMDKKHYIAPAIEVVELQTLCLLDASVVEESLIWSGESPGTAGPDEIDENSTFDSF